MRSVVGAGRKAIWLEGAGSDGGGAETNGRALGEKTPLADSTSCCETNPGGRVPPRAERFAVGGCVCAGNPAPDGAGAESAGADGAAPENAGADGAAPENAGADGAAPESAGADGAAPENAGAGGAGPGSGVPEGADPAWPGADGAGPAWPAELCCWT
ncbi:hypothetical protein [Sorangium sp. So ce854]|uniref:hypothetical protein n=1 Tax=Sorangium sp. So ce854 TaxID=3133322 RepID=UPI003F602EB7